MTAKPTDKTTFALLEREYYTSEEIFAKEYEHIYSREWIFAAHVSQLPEKGSFLKFEYGGEEIVVVRGANDQFHANLNVCRHRGFRLCAEETGKVRAFVCGYHQWRYNLDGGLAGVPQMADGEYFDYRDFPLRTAQVEVWHSMIFVNLHTEPIEALAERLAAFDNMIDKFAPEGTKLAHSNTYVLDANWKIVVDNALECYHCPGTHRTLCGVVDVAGLMNDLKEWLADDDGDGPSDLGQSGMRIQKGMQSLSADGTLITEKLLGSCTSTDVDNGISGGVMVVPNFFYAAFYVDHWWTIAIRPMSAGKTQLVYTWYVRADAEAGVDFDVDRLIEVGHTTQTEDNVLIARTQAGVESRYYVPGPIGSDVEPALSDYVANYLQIPRLIQRMSAVDVIVIGSGLAGLTAARDLRDRGYSVQVIEARDRLGGRTFTRPFTGHHEVMVEVGGAYLNLRSEHNLRREIDRYGIEVYTSEDPVQHACFFVDGELRTGLPVPVDQLSAVERAAIRMAADAARINAGVPLADQAVGDLDISIADYFGRLELPRQTHDFVVGLVAGWIQADAERTTIIHVLQAVLSCGGSPFDTFFGTFGQGFVNGVTSLIEAMVTGAELDIRLSSMVTEVDQVDCVVTVRTATGDCFTASACVVAAPAWTLGAINFDPPLADDKLPCSPRITTSRASRNSSWSRTRRVEYSPSAA